MIRSFILTLATILALASLTGCRTGKDLTYFDDLANSQTGVMGTLQAYELHIKPSDELVITVQSLDPAATADYNLPMANPAANSEATSSTTPSIQTYIVNSLGDINFPVLGKIHVAGMTTLELTEYLTARISEKVIDPVVRVSFQNFSVTVFGEVGTPKVVNTSSERLTLFEALAAAGDLSDYAKRENIIVAREVDGKMEYHRLNLKDSKIIESPYFFLQQNDVVYVEPNDIRQANSKYNTNNAFKLTVVSSVISAVSVIVSMVIALTR